MTPLPPMVNLVSDFLELGITARSQGSRPTCSLFAMTGLIDFEWTRLTAGPHVRLSQEYLTWAANKATGTTNDQAMFYEATCGLNELGICAEELMPYKAEGRLGRRPSERALLDAQARKGRWKVHWLRRWNDKSPMPKEELLAVKRALAERHPVVCGLRWPKEDPGPSLIDVPSAEDVFDGHSILFVGYEDDPTLPGGGCFTFRNHRGPDWGDQGCGKMSYAYAVAYANDALWLQLGEPFSEVPFVRYEAQEMLVPATSKCQARIQKMSECGGPMWSRSRQLLCKALDGGFVELEFSVAETRSYRVRLLATAAPDYGVVKVGFDGQNVTNADLYSGMVCPWGAIEMGRHKLTAGEHRLKVQVVGKNAVSDGYSFGLDCLELLV